MKNVVMSALHGWVGASLAIFMFFRPLEPWRIGRVKIWQGVIPAQQERIGEAIGDVVANELLTTQSMTSYLEQEGALEDWVGSTIGELADKLTQRDLPGLEQLFSPVAADLKDELKQQGKEALVRWATDYLGRPETKAWLKDFLHIQMGYLWEKPLQELYSEEQAKATLKMFLDRGGEYLQSPHCRKQVLKLLEEGHEYLCRQEVPLKEVLPQAVLDIVDQWPRGLAQVIPELVDRLRDSKEVTVRLTAVILEQMELMKERGTLAWIGIGLYQYFNEYEEEIWRFVRQDIFPRLSEFLASPEIKGWMERSIREQSEAILSRPIGELAGGIKGEQLAQTGDWLADRLVNWLNGDDARVWVESFLLDRYQDLADKRVIDICAKYLNLKPEEVEGGLTTYGIGLLNSPAAARLLESVANSLVDRAGDYPIGRLGDRFSKETLVKVEKKATALVTGYLKEKIPTFWGHMDIQAIVKGRISDYSSRELVVMFQKVTMNSLYRIEIYGGVIGAFMGLFFGLANMRTDAFWLVAAVLAALAVLLYFAKK